MDYTLRSNLVKQLAQSMGMQGGSVVEASNFDAATGTLYVGSRVYTPEQIEAAKEFIHGLTEKYRPLGDNTYQSYEIAELAIQMAQNFAMQNKGRIVINAERPERG